MQLGASKTNGLNMMAKIVYYFLFLPENNSSFNKLNYLGTFNFKHV